MTIFSRKEWPQTQGGSQKACFGGFPRGTPPSSVCSVSLIVCLLATSVLFVLAKKTPFSLLFDGFGTGRKPNYFRCVSQLMLPHYGPIGPCAAYGRPCLLPQSPSQARTVSSAMAIPQYGTALAWSCDTVAVWYLKPDPIPEGGPIYRLLQCDLLSYPELSPSVLCHWIIWC